jgi:lysophospholipase L1-like esterase
MAVMMVMALCMANAGMAGEPFLDMAELQSGLPGSIEIPTLGTWDGKTVYCVYSNDIKSIWVQSTQDSGKTWTEPVQVMGLSAPRYITDANLLVDRDRITVFATHVLESVDFPNKIAHSVFQTSVSEDGGRSWSAPTPLPSLHRYVCGCIHVPVWLDGDTVVMGWSWDVPAEEGKPSGTEGGMHLRAGVLISKDRGKTWTPGDDADLPQQAMGADEPALVRRSNGDLFMIVRTTTRPHETVSHDGGRTWERLKPGPFQGFNSPSALLRLRDGAILRAWDNSPTNRFPLVVSLSTDDCRTWSPPRTVTEPTVDRDGALSYATACYPSLAQAADGTILLAWWQRDTQGHSIVWIARLNREWIEEAHSLPPPRRIVAFGDSVTLGVRPGVTEYQTFRYLLQERLKQQGLNMEVVNAGTGGDNTRTALARLESDVLAEKSELVIVMFGVNDAAMVDGGPVARTEPRVPLQDYRANLKTIIGRVRGAGAKVLLCTPTPMSRKYLYQNVGAYAEHEDINYMLRDYAEAAKGVGSEMSVPVFDAFGLFIDRPDGLDMIEDGNHPYVKGHALIADGLVEPVRKLLAEE